VKGPGAVSCDEDGEGDGRGWRLRLGWEYYNLCLGRGFGFVDRVMVLVRLTLCLAWMAVIRSTVMLRILVPPKLIRVFARPFLASRPSFAPVASHCLFQTPPPPVVHWHVVDSADAFGCEVRMDYGAVASWLVERFVLCLVRVRV
jgi:hypothetical protein